MNPYPKVVVVIVVGGGTGGSGRQNDEDNDPAEEVDRQIPNLATAKTQ